MIVQCPGCRELVRLEQFTAHNDALVFVCPACRNKQRLESQRGAANTPVAAATPVAPSAPSAPIDAPRIPARVTPAPEAPAEAPAAPSTVPTVAAPAPAPVEVKAGPEQMQWQAWNKVIAEWDKAAAHDSFVALCAGTQSLPFAGMRYRERLTQVPDDAMAKKGRDRVLTQAMVLAQSAKEVERPEGFFSEPKNRKLIGGMLGFVVLAILFALIRAAGRVPVPGNDLDY